MKTKKIIRYRLGVSRVFPKTHLKKGEATYFSQKILLALMREENKNLSINATTPQGERLSPKFHTIRANYPLWEKRMKKVQEGEAVIELFYWEDKPYNSKQVVFATLDKDSECGVQEVILNDKNNPFNSWAILINKNRINFNDEIFLSELAKNDGLSLQDFEDWFKGYDLAEPMAIIHFTKFRY